jgi:hypothetical protein
MWHLHQLHLIPEEKIKKDNSILRASDNSLKHQLLNSQGDIFKHSLELFIKVV